VPGTTNRGFYVQVRYPRAERWLTVAVSSEREVAARLAGDMYRNLRNDVGDSPVQIRIAPEPKLRREGGDDAINEAAADLWRRAQSQAWPDPTVNPG
jgi:hypothetical protein